MIASDYSGSHGGSKYVASAFLLADAQGSIEWPHLRNIVRGRFLADGRRMSFKALNDRHRQDALGPFLRAADRIHGLCAVIIVDRSITRLSSSQNTMQLWDALVGLRGRWNPQAFEMMARIVHFQCLLVSSFASPLQHVTWISDQDEIMANDERHTDLMNLVARLISLYIDFPLGEFAMNSTQVDSGDRAFEDFVAIPDLVAGAFSELISASAPASKREPKGERVLLPTGWSEKSQMITSWFFEKSHPLKRCAILIDRFDDQRYCIQRIQEVDL